MRKPAVYRVLRLDSGPWVVKFGITTLSYWPTRSRAIDAAVERASDFWSRAPRGFREIVVYAADEDGRDQVVWSSVARTATGRP